MRERERATTAEARTSIASNGRRTCSRRGESQQRGIEQCMFRSTRSEAKYEGPPRERVRLMEEGLNERGDRTFARTQHAPAPDEQHTERPPSTTSVESRGLEDNDAIGQRASEVCSVWRRSNKGTFKCQRGAGGWSAQLFLSERR